MLIIENGKEPMKVKFEFLVNDQNCIFRGNEFRFQFAPNWDDEFVTYRIVESRKETFHSIQASTVFLIVINSRSSFQQKNPTMNAQRFIFRSTQRAFVGTVWTLIGWSALWHCSLQFAVSAAQCLLTNSSNQYVLGLEWQLLFVGMSKCIRLNNSRKAL